MQKRVPHTSQACYFLGAVVPLGGSCLSGGISALPLSPSPPRLCPCPLTQLGLGDVPECPRLNFCGCFRTGLEPELENLTFSPSLVGLHVQAGIHHYRKERGHGQQTPSLGLVPQISLPEPCPHLISGDSTQTANSQVSTLAWSPSQAPPGTHSFPTVHLMPTWCPHTPQTQHIETAHFSSDQLFLLFPTVPGGSFHPPELLGSLLIPANPSFPAQTSLAGSAFALSLYLPPSPDPQAQAQAPPAQVKSKLLS